jgi:hypothetical protein
MALPLSAEAASNRASEVVLPPRLGRNEPCHCGSGIKYKRCCREQNEALRRQLRGAALPAWMDNSRSKLRQFEKYVCNVFGLPDLFASLTDTRRAPKIPTFDVVNSLFHSAVLRIPSINALEGDLKKCGAPHFFRNVKLSEMWSWCVRPLVNRGFRHSQLHIYA